MQPKTHDTPHDPFLTETGLESQRAILAFIIEYKQAHDGISPSIAEIAEGVFLSTAGVKYHLRLMHAYGTIKVLGRRSITVPGGRWLPPENHAQAVAAQREHDQAEAERDQELKQMRQTVQRLEEDLEALQDAVECEVSWWKAKAAQFHHLLQQRVETALAFPEYDPAYIGGPDFASRH